MQILHTKIKPKKKNDVSKSCILYYSYGIWNDLELQIKYENNLS